MTTDTPPAPQRTLHACLAIGFMLMAAIVLGHDGRRVVQLALLAAPVLALLAWPIRGAALHRVRIALVWLWVMAFVFDGIARAYLLDAYGAAPDSGFVQAATANTHGREAWEYLAMHWRSLLLWSATLAAAGLFAGRYARHGARGGGTLSRWGVVGLSVVLLATSIAYLSKPWRRLHPLVFWTQWSQSVHTLRANWADQQRERDALLAHAKSVRPSITHEGAATIVLVITDSINRDNMGLYGYKRNTTPRLQAHKANLQDQMLVLRNAWSVDASTLPSLRNMFHFGLPQADKPQHVLALARAAGYKVWWMSNHDDLAVEQQHARLADFVDIVNRVPGRAGASLDGELLDCVQEALTDPAERKLIVVHLMGAHPHYSMRFPPGENPFDDEVDAVEADLEKNGRPAWVRRFRQEYDAALLYHDFVVSETLQLTRGVGRAGEYRAWMYLSDHGQEVGHGGNHAGHSPATASGYRIPAVVWRNQTPAGYPEGAQNRAFRADWAGWTLAGLLKLRWDGDAHERDPLLARYRWEAPVLPVAVPSFEQ